jgi:hypothetical protein
LLTSYYVELVDYNSNTIFSDELGLGFGLVFVISVAVVAVFQRIKVECIKHELDCMVWIMTVFIDSENHSCFKSTI